jgi:phosphate transport system substrate-binding protein
MMRLAGEFMRQYPNVRVMVEAGGTEKALVGFLDGHAASRRGDGNIAGHTASNQIQLMASSRKLTAAEVAAFVSRHGYEPTELPIATDAVAIYVHKDSPLKELTLDQVDALFSASQKRGNKASLSTWGQVGLNHGAGDTPIRLIGRDRRSGTREFFREHVLLGGEFKELVQEVPGSASVIYEVARDRYAIGYSGIGYQTPLVRTLALADREGAPFVAPNVETALNGSYPLTRPLYLYVNKMPDEPMTPVMLEFLKFINSREGQEAVVSAGVYPLQARRASRNLALLGVGKAPTLVSTTK